MTTIPTPSPAMWPFGRIKPGKNSREVVVDDGIRELHQSILKIGQLDPVLVLDQETDNLIAGFRRYAAMGLGGIETVSVLVYPPSLTTTQRRVINLTENLQRVDLTDREVLIGCTELMELNPDWQARTWRRISIKTPAWLPAISPRSTSCRRRSMPSWPASSVSRRHTASPRALTSVPLLRWLSPVKPATRWTGRSGRSATAVSLRCGRAGSDARWWAGQR